MPEIRATASEGQAKMEAPILKAIDEVLDEIQKAHDDVCELERKLEHCLYPAPPACEAEEKDHVAEVLCVKRIMDAKWAAERLTNQIRTLVARLGI